MALHENRIAGFSFIALHGELQPPAFQIATGHQCASCSLRESLRSWLLLRVEQTINYRCVKIPPALRFAAEDPIQIPAQVFIAFDRKAR